MATQPGRNRGHDRAELLAYEKKLLPLVQEWGRIEIQGMRPAITDLRSGQGVPAVTIGGEARAWQSGLKGLRVKMARLSAPSFLSRAKAMFDQAMGRYIDAAVLFEKAADGSPQDRNAGIEQGVDAALDGARIYNQASILLQNARHRVGLSTTSDFPDQPAAQ